MNRQMKRMMQRQGQVAADGTPTRSRPQQRPGPRPASERVSPGEYVRQVRAELRKVAWPTRAEVINYSTIVFATLIVLTALIFLLDWLFGKGVFFLFDV